MMTAETGVDLEFAKALIEARAIAITIAMENADSNLFHLAVVGHDLRLLEEFRTMQAAVADETFMVNIQLDVAHEGEERDALVDRVAALEARMTQILTAITILEAVEKQILRIIAPGRSVYLNTSTLEMLTIIDNARIMETGTL